MLHPRGLCLNESKYLKSALNFENNGITILRGRATQPVKVANFWKSLVQLHFRKSFLESVFHASYGFAVTVSTCTSKFLFRKRFKTNLSCVELEICITRY